MTEYTVDLSIDDITTLRILASRVEDENAQAFLEMFIQSLKLKDEKEEVFA